MYLKTSKMLLGILSASFANFLQAGLPVYRGKNLRHPEFSCIIHLMGEAVEKKVKIDPLVSFHQALILSI